ncbi:MAG: hypothetical protein QXI97_08620 [Nitrososphaerota archaeon]
MLVGIPPHRAPKVVRKAGLTDSTGWVPVDPYTLKTGFENIFAIGDMAAVMNMGSIAYRVALAFAYTSTVS